MLTQLPMIEDLPQQNATQVKNKWGDVARQVQESGSLAITSHSAVEMVILSASTYRKYVAIVAELSAREEKSQLDELSQRFKERLTILQRPDARGRLDAMLGTKGKLKKRPIAGESF